MKAKVIFLMVAIFALSTGMQAQNWKKNKDRKPVKVEKRYRQNTRVSTPRQAKTIAVLPYGYHEIRHNKAVYYYAEGNYYRPVSNRHYKVVRPQIGMIVPAIPQYNMVRYNGRMYYAYQNYLYSRINTPYGISFRVDIRL